MKPPGFRLPTTRGLFILLLLLGFALRVHRLGDRSVWWDEGLAAWAARQPLADMAHWTATDVHPPLYFALLHFWRLMSGDSEFGLRLMSAVLGTLTIAATYLLGQRVGGKTTGLLAAVLLATSRFAVDWSQEMRMYTLAALLAVLVLWTALKIYDLRFTIDDWRVQVGYVLVMAAGLYTLYLFVSVLVVVNGVWLFFQVAAFARNRPSPFPFRPLLHWIGLQTAVLLLYAPWLNYAIGKIPTWSTASPITLVDFLKIYWTVLTIGIPLQVEDYYAWTLPVLGIFLFGLTILLISALKRSSPPSSRFSLFLLLASLLFPAVIVYLISLPGVTFFYTPQFAPRYLLLFAPVYAVLLAWGIKSILYTVHRTQLKKPSPSLLSAGYWLLGTGLTAVLLITHLFSLSSYYPGRVLGDDYSSLTATIAAYQWPNDAVILHNDTDWPIFAYHHPGPWSGIPHAWTITPETAENYLAPIWETHDGVWLVLTPYAAVSDPQNAVTNWLQNRALAVVEYPYEDKLLRFYSRTSERTAEIHQLSPTSQPRYPLTAEFAPLLGYDQFVRDVQNGDTLHLFLYVEGAGQTAEIGLLDAQGQTWQAEQMTIGGPRQQVDFLLSPDTPPGDYRFYARWENSQLLPFGQFRLRPKGGLALSLADVTIPHPLQADFGDHIRLLGYEIETAESHPGGTLYITLYWQAQAPVSQRYKVFTHLLGQVFNADSGNFLWGQQDNEPVSNTRPTTTWRTGEVVVDSYAIPVSAQAPGGNYQVEIGLYNPVTGERLLVMDGADHVVVTAVSIASSSP